MASNTVKRGADLLRWTRGVYMAWWDTRHDAKRESPDVMLARVYIQGGIDALRDEVQRVEDEGTVKP